MLQKQKEDASSQDSGLDQGLPWGRLILVGFILLSITVATIMWIYLSPGAGVLAILLTGISVTLAFLQIAPSLFSKKDPISRQNITIQIPSSIREQSLLPSPLLLPVPSDTWPIIWNVPYRRNSFFTGREKLLKSLHEQLTGTNVVALTQTLAIHGLGGIGKTQTAIEYAYRYQQEYQAVFWARAAARDILISDYVNVADLLHLVEKNEQDQLRIVQIVKRWFTNHENWLLILDNADDLEILADFLPNGEKGHLLLTTRDPSVEGMAYSIAVEQMDIQEGCTLLLRRAGLLGPAATLEQASQNDRKMAERIITEMGGLPLAIDQAAAYIEQTQCEMARYLQVYQEHRAELLKWKGRILSDYPKTVATTWAIAFEQVEQHHPAATDLLRLCAFLDPDNIPEDLFTEGVSELDPILRMAVNDVFAFNEAIDILRSFSLIRRLIDTKSLTIHRLVQLVLKDRMDSPTQRQWAERVVHLVHAAFPEVEFKTWKRCKRYLPQVFACFDLMTLHDIQTTEAATLLQRAGIYLGQQVRYKEAEPLLQRVLEIHEKALGPEHLAISTSLNDLADLYQAQGRYREAEPLLRRVLEIREKALGSEQLATNVALSVLANLYQNQGRYREAEPLLQKVLEIREKALGPEHLATATALSALANLYQAQGRYREAEPLLRRVLEIREKTLGPEHLDLSALANLYQDQGRYREAEPLLQKVLEIREKTLGPEHLGTSTTLSALADLYQAQRRYKEAEPLLQKVLEIREKTLDSEHLDTTALSALANLYQAQRRYKEAEPLLQRALEIYEKTLDPEHLAASTALYDLADLYQAQRRYKEAESLLQRALEILEKTLSSELFVATALNALADLYQAQRRYKEAEPLLQRALEIREKTLGSEHFATSTTLNALANLHQAQGRYREAEPLLQRALEICEKTQGPEHPNFSIYLNNLANLYQAQRRYKEAEPLLRRALEIREKTLGPEHLWVAPVLENYARLLRKMHRRKEAAQLETRVQIIRAKQKHGQS